MRILVKLGFVVAVASLAAGQALQPTLNTSDGGALKSFSEVLKEHGFAMTVPDLFRALQGSEPNVRVAAGYEFADVDNAENARDELADALVSETMPDVQIAIAYSLSRLSDERGVRALDAMCLDRSHSPDIRGSAARAIFAASSYAGGSGACPELLFDLLANTDADWPATKARIIALNLAPDYVRHGLSAKDTSALTELVIRSLTVKHPDERQSAAAAFRFGRFGGKKAISALRRALVTEQNLSIRLEMEAAVAAVGTGEIAR